MRKLITLVGVLAGAGVLIGGLFGFVVSPGISCVADFAPSCYRVLGFYLSGTTYYTLAGAVIAGAIGLGLGIFVATPLLLWEGRPFSSSSRPLEHPLAWLGLVLVELVVLVPALLFGIPDPGVWPEALRVGTWVVVLAAVTVMNYAIRRRFIPR